MFRVTGDRVALIPIEDPDHVGRIIIPDMAKQRTDQGIVKYVGPEARDFYPGQFVIFNGYSGTILKIQDPDRPLAGIERLIIVREKFIYGEFVDVESTDIPGLYFRTRAGDYFEATYEQSLELIAQAVRTASWRKLVDVRTPMPAREEYDGVVGG